MRQWFVLAVVFSSVFQAFAASDEWTGVWRVSRFFEGKLEGIYHIRITDSQPDRVLVYDHEGRPMIIQEVSLQAETLDLLVANSSIQPLPLAFKLTRTEQRLSGEWLFSQFQLSEPVQGAAFGFQVFSDAEWEPWAAVEEHRGDGVIDLVGLVLSGAPLNNFRRFEGYWKEKIEVPYYFLVEGWLYGDGQGWDQRRRQTLAALWEGLRKPGPVREMAGKFSELAQRAVLTARERTGNQDSNFLVSFFGSDDQALSRLWTRVPTEEEEASCACKLDLRESFLFFNPANFAGGENGSTLMLKGMLRDMAWGRFSSGLAVEVFRQAWAMEAALEASGRSVPEPDPEIAGLMRDAFGSQLLSAGSAAPGAALNDERLTAESLSFVLGRAFVKWLRTNQPGVEFLKLTDRAVMEGWIEYLTGRHVEPRGRDRRTP